MVKKYRPYIKNVLLRHFPEEGKWYLAESEKNFDALQNDLSFVEKSGNPMDKRIVVAGYFLAVIKALEKREIGAEKIREVLLEVASDSVMPANNFLNKIRKLSTSIFFSAVGRAVLRVVDKKLKKKFHKEGFKLEILTGKEETLGTGYGVDILECGICKFYSKLNYQKYVPVLCEIDHIMSEVNGLKLIRTGTIAGGAEKCDFRFQKAD